MTEGFIPDQEKALRELRELLKDEIPTEMHQNTILLTKFLTARDFDVKKAESMIRKNVRWKKQMQIDTILTDFKAPEVLMKYFHSKIIGYDKEGYVIRYVPLGKCDMKGICKSANSTVILKHAFQMIQEEITMQESQSEKLGKSLRESIALFDMDQTSLNQITDRQAVQIILKYAMVAQDNYPEMLHKLFIINASTYALTLWAVVKNCLDSGVLKKVFVYGEDGWKEELLKIIDVDVLPAFLGGNRKDPDGNPMCLTIVSHLGPVPKKYFLEKNIENFARKSGVKLALIDRRGCCSIPIQITESKSTIYWEFELECYDVGFGLLLETAGESTEELIPVHTIATEYEPYFGMYRCKKPGNHLIVFENSYSWFHSKKVYYRTWVTDTDEKEDLDS